MPQIYEKLNWWSRILVLSCVVWCFVGVAAYLTQEITRRDPLIATDFSNLWASGRLVSLGDNVYSSQQWHAIYEEQIPTIVQQDDAFVYPLPTAILFVPLGLLAEPTARDIWLTFSQFLVVGTAMISVVCVDWRHNRAPILPFIILSLLIYVPAILTVMNGQITSLLGFDIAVAIYLLSRKKWGLAGAALGFLILKPAGGGAFLGVIGLWFILSNKWQGIMGILMTVGLFSGLAWLIHPGWIGDWLNISSNKLAISWEEMPTVWGVCALLIGSMKCWMVVAGGLSAILVLGIVWKIAHLDSEVQPQWLSGILIPLSLVITPYLHSYDFVLLIPSTVTMTALLDRAKTSFVIVSFFPLAISFLGACFYIHSEQSNQMVWIAFPLIIMMIHLGIWQYASRKEPNAMVRL